MTRRPACGRFRPARRVEGRGRSALRQGAPLRHALWCGPWSWMSSAASHRGPKDLKIRATTAARKSRHDECALSAVGKHYVDSWCPATQPGAPRPIVAPRRKQPQTAPESGPRRMQSLRGTGAWHRWKRALGRSVPSRASNETVLAPTKWRKSGSPLVRLRTDSAR